MTTPSDWLRATLQTRFHPTTYAVVVAIAGAVLRSPQGTCDVGDFQEIPFSLPSVKRGIRELKAAGLLDVTPTLAQFNKSGRSIYRLKLPPVSPPV